ncbi:unnamed protein product, partial [Cuscuta epithymum]
MCRSW